MKRYTTGLASLMVLAATTAFAVAPPAAPRRNDLAQAEARVGQFAAQTKGGPQQRLLLEKQKIHRMIESLDAGEHVDPAEIDEALQNAERGL